MPAAIVPLIAAVGVPGLVTATGTLTALGSIVAGGIGVGLSLGANMLLNRGRGGGQGGPAPQEVRGVIRQSVSSRTRHYGRVRVGGSIVFIETENGNLHQVIAFGQGLFDGIEGYYIDDNVFTLGPGTQGGQGWAQESPHEGRSVYIETRVGTSVQSAFQILVQRFGSIWSNEHRLNGIACAHMIAHAVPQEDFSRIYPNRIPVLNVLARGARVYDPRSGATAWDTNLALILRDYLTHSDGARIPSALIDETLFVAAANVCDEVVQTKTGPLRRYHGSMSYSLESDPADVVQRLLRAMDGRLYLTGEGKIGLLAGQWIEPTVTIADEHIIDYEIGDGAGPFRQANEVILKYTDTASGYSEATIDPWRDEASISEMGAVLSQSIDAYEVQQHNHGRRLAKIAMHRANPRWTGRIRTTLQGLEAFDQRFIRVRILDEAIDENFEVLGWALDPQSMTVTLDISSMSHGAYLFDAATEEGSAPANPTVLQAEAIGAPAAVSTGTAMRRISQVTTTDTSSSYTPPTPEDPGGNSQSSTETTHAVESYVLTATWTPAPRPDLRGEAEYAAIGSNNWIAMPVAPGASHSESPPLARGATYAVRARYRATGSAASAWVHGPNVTIPN